MSVIYDNTVRIYGPRIYTRHIEETDWQHLQAIYGDYKDFPLTEPEARELCNVWARNSRLCQWPLNENTDMQSNAFFCLRSNDLPIGLFRSSFYKYDVTVLLTLIHPDYQQDGYFYEGVGIVNQAAWDVWGCESTIAELRTDFASLEHIRGELESEGIRRGPGLKAVEHKKTTLTRAGWEAYKASPNFVNYEYTIYPTWPPEE